MNKIAPLILACCSIISCEPGSTASTDKLDLSAKDTLKKQTPSLGDAARLNIDAVLVMPDKFKVLLENEYVRVVEYSLQPGEKDGWHTHPAKSSYVVSGGKLKVFLENGESFIADEETGLADWSAYVGKHYVENIGSTTVTIVLTEIKSLEGL